MPDRQQFPMRARQRPIQNLEGNYLRSRKIAIARLAQSPVISSRASGKFRGQKIPGPIYATRTAKAAGSRLKAETTEGVEGQARRFCEWTTADERLALPVQCPLWRRQQSAALPARDWQLSEWLRL